METGHPKRIVVTGDVTIDWNIARLSTSGRPEVMWNADDTSRVCWQRGGAALLADVIEVVLERPEPDGGPSCAVYQTGAPTELVNPADGDFNHSHAMWEPFADGDSGVWRVKEFLGLEPARELESDGAQDWQRVVNDPSDADVVVLDDANLGFRANAEGWPQAITASGKARWVLAKMASPVAQGALWDHLIERNADRLVVVTTVNDLRRTDIQISRELSWERTAQDLYWELTRNPTVSALSRCAHVVVSLYGAGALVLSRKPDSDGGQTASAWDCQLVFDPAATEGSWSEGHPGGMVGFTTCLAASLARELLRNPDQPDVVSATRAGVEAMRLLQEVGYGAQDPGAALTPPEFPRGAIAEALSEPPKSPELASALVEDPTLFLPGEGEQDVAPPEGEFWTILEDLCRSDEDPSSECCDVLAPLARRVVVEGPDVALEMIPRASFGALVTADRREVEGYRSISALIREYCASPQKRPLTIAVFGPPGAGKSFGVTQVAKSTGVGEVEEIEFNLSQMGGPDDLIDALHQVRDLRLSGALPLVFWDEFDTSLGDKELGWLRYFLAPMQDGKFQEGQIVHPIGPAVFVFAGGTSARVDEFGEDMDIKEFKGAKGPDFVSRLKGYVNVMGPDCQSRIGAGEDSCWMIRRSLLLRNLLSRNAPHLFDQPDGEGNLRIDPGVLRAFLEVGAYGHGARSMESIILTSTLSGKQSFQRSSLPSEDQLNLHVNGREFLSLVQMPNLTGALLDALCRAAHEAYCEGVQAQLDSGEIEEMPEAATRAYDDLPADLQDLNRGNVEGILPKLAKIGYVMIPARSNEPPFGFPGGDLDMLAEMEHDRWVHQKVEQEWVYGPERDDKEKTNPALLPWEALTDEDRSQLDPAIAAALGDDALPETEKEKDRALVRAIPRILAKAGYTVARLQGH